MISKIMSQQRAMILVVEERLEESAEFVAFSFVREFKRFA
jgi:hypothetical protein